jgi:pyridoxal phosphate enzyme (YggS family)
MDNVAKKSPLADRLDEVRERIAAAAAKARRDPREITLVAVTKTAAPEQIREILQLGVTDLGENRVQVLTQRAAQLNEFFSRRIARGETSAPAKLRWHMIGHLQRNKVKGLLPLVHMVQSVDSLRLAEEIEAQAAKTDRRVPVMLEINASEEATKTGVAVGAATHLAEQIDTMPHLQLAGLMAMGPLGADEKTTRNVFARTKEIFDEMRWEKIGGNTLRHLSMGMSGDLEAAIAEGSTMVRVGTALFGGKPQDDGQDEVSPA